jgi:hypothetical protein
MASALATSVSAKRRQKAITFMTSKKYSVATLQVQSRPLLKD